MIAETANQVRELRKRAGLTQRTLAEVAATSQQQIQRIEAGQTTRLDLAARIAQALNAPLEVAFPAAKRSRPSHGPFSIDDSLDVDPRQFFLKVAFDSGLEKIYAISSADAVRFQRKVDGSPSRGIVPFFSFDSSIDAVAINLSRLAHAHLLWEGVAMPEHEDDAGSGITVFLSSGKDPRHFEVGYDDPPDGDDDPGQIRNLLLQLDIGPELHEFVSFEDIDGEWAYFRASSIDIIEVHTDIIAPPDHDDEEDG